MSQLTREQELELLELEEEELRLTMDQPAPTPAPSRGAIPMPQQASEGHEITKDDLDGATQGLQVRPEIREQAKKVVPFFGGKVEGEEAPLSQRVLGFLGDSLGFGLPQKAFIESQHKDAAGMAKFYRNLKSTLEGPEAVGDLTDDEAEYLDRVRQMAVAKKGWGQWIAEAGVGMLTPGGLVAKMGRGAKLGTKAAIGAAEGATVGGAAGVGYSKRGEELEGGLTGGLLGGALGGSIASAPELYMRAIGLSSSADDAVANSVKRSAGRLNVEEMVEKELQKTEVQDKLALFKELAADKKALFTPVDFTKPKKAPRVTPLTRQMADKMLNNKKAAGKANLKFAKGLVRAGEADNLEDALQRLDFNKEIRFKSMAKRFRKFHGIKNGRDLEQKLRQGGEDAYDEMIDQWYRTELGQQAVMRELPKKSPKVIGPLTKAFFFMSDGKPVQMYIDNLLGTNLSPAIDAMSRKAVIASHIADKAVEELEDLVGRKLVPKSIKELEANKFADMPDELRKFYAGLLKVFNGDEFKLGIKDLGPNYIPHVFKGRKQVQLDVTEAFKKWRKGELNAAETKDFARSLELLTDFKIKRDEHFEKAFNYYIQRPDISYKQAQTTKAAAAMEREGRMPMLLREDDVYTATISYMRNTFRHAANKDGLKEIRFVRDMARKAAESKKAESVAYVDEYLTNLMADITGTRTQGNFLYKLGQEAVANFEKNALIMASEAKDEGTKKFYKAAADLPDVMRAVNAFVYPNFIGLNPRSILQNLSSPYFMNVGAFGSRYGSAVAMEAALDSAALAKKGLGSWDNLVAKMGYIEPKFRGELTEAARESMALTSGLAKEAVDKWVDFSMYFFSQSEKFARVQNHFMATRVAKDLIRASKGAKGFRSDAAKKFLDDIPDRAYRRRLAKAYNTGNEDALIDGVRQYLNAQSMFNYNRANMSEFGRVMGPIFSVFTKWPTTMYGRVFQQMADEGKLSGGGRLARMFLYPMMLAAAADGIMEQTGATGTPQHELFVGRRGVQSWTPASNLMAWTSGEFLMPPFIQTMSGLGEAAGDFMVDGNLKKAAKSTERAVGGYVPFYNIAPLLLKRTPQLMGEEPESRTITDFITE